MERVTVLAKAGSTSRRQVSIEKWVDSIVPEGDPEYMTSSDGAVTCNEDDLLLGADAKMMTVDDAALRGMKSACDENIINHTIPIENRSTKLSELTPMKHNLHAEDKESIMMDHMTASINDHVKKDANSHVTSKAKDHVASDVGSHFTYDTKDHMQQKMVSDAEVDYMDADCERELSWRTKLAVLGLIHMDSIQSQPEINNKTYTCVDDILQDRTEDPEEILTNLGFAQEADVDSPVFKVPVRFLKASTQASSNLVKTFLENNPEFKEYLAAKGVIIDDKQETEESNQKNTHSFHKIARKISTMKKATDLMRPSVAVFPGLSCIKSPVDNSVTWKVEPVQYVAPTGTRYHSILHPHNAKYRAEQGLYEHKPLSPEVLAKLRLNNRRKSWFSQKQQAVGGFEGISVETTDGDTRFPGVHSNSTKIIQHNADQRRRMFRDAKGSPLPYPIYKNTPRTSPTDPYGDISPSGNASENTLQVPEQNTLQVPEQNTLQVPEQFQVNSERFVQNPAACKVSRSASSLKVPVSDWTNQHVVLGSLDSNTVSCDVNVLSCDMREIFCDNSFLQLKADEEAACDNEIEAINSKICDESNDNDNNQSTFETCIKTCEGEQGLHTDINSNGKPAGHLDISEQNTYPQNNVSHSQGVLGWLRDEDVGYAQNLQASLDSGRSEMLQSFDLEEIQSSDINGSDTQQQQLQRKESFRKLIHKDTYTRVSSIQSDSSGFGESIDQLELSSDLHKKICNGHIHIGSPVPEASSIDSDEAQEFQASVSRSINMDRTPKSSAIPLVQMVEKQPDYGVERFTLQQPPTSDPTISWIAEPSEPRVGQLVELDVDVMPTSGSEPNKKAYPKEKDPWKTDSVMDDDHKMALLEFGNFLSENSDITLCESDDESSPINETVDFVGETNQSDPVKDMPNELNTHKEAIKELGDLLANTLHDSGSAEESSDSDAGHGPVINRIVINRDLNPAVLNAKVSTAKEISTAGPAAPVTVEFTDQSPEASGATAKTKPSHQSEDTTSSSDSECEHGKQKDVSKKGTNQKRSDSEDSPAESKIHGFFRKLTKDKKKKKTKVLDQLAKSTLTGCRVKNDAENDLKTSEPASVQNDSMVLSQLAEMTASTGLKVTNVNPGANKLIRDDLVQEGNQFESTPGEDKADLPRQEVSSVDRNASHRASADFDVKRPSFLSADYETMHHLVENQHPVDTSDAESDVYDDAPQSLDHLHTRSVDLQELSDGSMETALSELQASDVTSVNTLHSLDDVNVNVLAVRRRSSSSSSSSSSDNNTEKDATAKQFDQTCSSQSWPTEPSVKVENIQAESAVEDRDSGSYSEGSHSVWDKTLTSSDIEYLDNLAIELAVPRCVSSTRAREEAKRKASQQSSNQMASDQVVSELSEDEIANGRQSDKSESSPLSRFMKKLQPKTKSEKRHKAALKKSETIANADDLRSRHDKGSRVSKPAILRRRRKNRSKSEPGSIDVDQLEELSPGSKKKSDSKSFSQWFKNILHTPKSKNAKDLQQSSQTDDASKKKDNGKEQKKQQKTKDGSESIHDAITQLALSTLPMNPEVQNSQFGGNYTSAESEASSKWGVSDSDEECDLQKRSPEDDVLRTIPVQTSVTIVQHHKSEPASDDSPELIKNESLRSSVRSTISQLHVNLRKTESLGKAHKTEMMLIVEDGKVKDIKKCDSDKSELSIAPKDYIRRHSGSCGADDAFPDSLSLQSGSSSLQSGSSLSSAAGQRQVALVHINVEPPESSTVALLPNTTSTVQPTQQPEDLQQNKGTIAKISQTHPSDVYVCPFDGGQDFVGECGMLAEAPLVYKSTPEVCCHRDKTTSGSSGTRQWREACQHQILCHLMKHPGMFDIPDSCQCEDLPVWPQSTNQDERQHLLSEVQLLQKALHKYKLEFRALELKSSAIYLSLANVLSSEDRGASDSLRELQHDISNEISVMEQNLRTCHSSLLTPDNSDKDVLSMNMARLHIIREMIELLKEQIYRGSIISVTKQRVDHSIDQLDNKDNTHQQVPVAEQYGGELIPQMVLLQKQLESQQLLMARALSTQMEELQSTVLEEIRRSVQQQPTVIPHHYPRSPEQNSPGSSGYEGVSQSTATENAQTCRSVPNSPHLDDESHYVIEVSPETTQADQQISVSSPLSLHDELVSANKCYHGDSSVTHDHSRWQQHDSGYKEGEELFV